MAIGGHTTRDGWLRANPDLSMEPIEAQLSTDGGGQIGEPAGLVTDDLVPGVEVPPSPETPVDFDDDSGFRVFSPGS